MYVELVIDLCHSLSVSLRFHLDFVQKRDTISPPPTPCHDMPILIFHTVPKGTLKAFFPRRTTNNEIVRRSLSIPTLNPLLEIIVESFESFPCLLAESNHVPQHTLSDHEGESSIELLLLHERCGTLVGFALGEVEGVVPVESAHETFAAP